MKKVETANGKVKSSEYWLTQICSRFAKNGGDNYVNPIRRSSTALYAFDALERLGKNSWHQLDEVGIETKRLMESVMHTDDLSLWDAFMINSKCDATDRLHKIIMSLQISYGNRLQTMRSAVQFSKRNGTTFVRLMTRQMSETDAMAFHTKNKKQSIVTKLVQCLACLLSF